MKRTIKDLERILDHPIEGGIKRRRRLGLAVAILGFILVALGFMAFGIGFIDDSYQEANPVPACLLEPEPGRPDFRHRTAEINMLAK